MEDSNRSGSPILLEDPIPAALILRIAGGEASAMTELYDSTNRLLFGLVLRIVPDRAEAEEVLLEVYSQVWRRAEEYSPKNCSAMAWLTAMARSHAIERIRAIQQVPARPDAPEPAGTHFREAGGDSGLSVAAVRRKLVCFALEALPPEQRQVIHLAYYGGLSHGEICARLGLQAAAVKKHTRLGIIKLSDQLRPLIEGRPEPSRGVRRA